MTGKIAERLEPVAWAYLRTSLEGRDERALQARHVVELLERDGAGERVVDNIADRLKHAQVAPGLLAVFADAEGTIVQERLLPGDATEDFAGYTAPAKLWPVLAVDQQRPPFVSVVIDHVGADLVFSTGGAAPDRRERVTGPDDEIAQHASGGWAGLSQSRMQRRALDSWQHNAHQAAERVMERVAAVEAQVVVVAGDERAVKFFLDRIAVDAGTMIHRVGGSRAALGARHDQEAWLRHALHDVAGIQTARLLRALYERLDSSGLAVEGVPDSLQALAEGRVATLLVDPVAVRGTAWFGAQGTDVYPDREAAARSGKPVRSGNLVDVAVRAALGSGGNVRVLERGTAGTPSGGIGALCRFGT
jgi:hypothetical protein